MQEVTENGGGTVLIGILCFFLGVVFTIVTLTFLNRNNEHEN